MGCIAYADDLILLAPPWKAAQEMLKTCEEFALENNVKFSTDPDIKKSKCMAMFVTGSKSVTVNPTPLVLCDRNLPWIQNFDHLGHVISSNCSFEDDCRQKRAEFISNAMKTRENFSFAHPQEVVNATQKYCTSYYSSNLWDLRGHAAEMIYASWRTNAKLVWGLPRQSKNYFLKFLMPDTVPPNVALFAKFHKFFHALLDSPSPEVQLVCRLYARDLRTKLGEKCQIFERGIWAGPMGVWDWSD